jgi:hypothetical protein
MTKEIKSSEHKKKNLPPGVEQVGLKEYKELHKKALENRHKQKQSSKTADKITQILLIVFGIPFLGVILYFGISLLMSQPNQ